MLHGRLVVGIRNSAMSQKLQMDSELTLEKAMKTVRQSTAVKEQQDQLKQLKEGSKGNTITIEEITQDWSTSEMSALMMLSTIRWSLFHQVGCTLRMPNLIGIKLQRMRGCHEYHLASYLDEFMYRERYGRPVRQCNY